MRRALAAEEQAHGRLAAVPAVPPEPALRAPTEPAVAAAQPREVWHAHAKPAAASRGSAANRTRGAARCRNSARAVVKAALLRSWPAAVLARLVRFAAHRAHAVSRPARAVRRRGWAGLAPDRWWRQAVGQAAVRPAAGRTEPHRGDAVRLRGWAALAPDRWWRQAAGRAAARPAADWMEPHRGDAGRCRGWAATAPDRRWRPAVGPVAALRPAAESTAPHPAGAADPDRQAGPLATAPCPWCR